MTEDLDLLERAVAAARRTVGELQPAELGLPSPCAEWTAGEVVNHLIDISEMMATALAGGTGELRTSLTPRPVAELVPALTAATQGVLDGWRALPEHPAPLHFSFSEMPVHLAHHVILTDLTMHTWDVLKATGRPREIDPAVAARVLANSRQLISPDRRGPGKFLGHEVPCPDNAPLADRLAAFWGRQP